jgi:hypothetical protein
LKLRRGDRLRASLRSVTPGASLRLSLNNGHRRVARGRLIDQRIVRPGVYYVGVSGVTAPVGADYRLDLRRR